MRAIVDNTSDAIFVKDVQGRYLLMNPSGAALCGMRVGEIVGKTDEELFDAETARGLRESDREMLAHPTARTFEESLLIDGALRYYSTAKFPFFDAQGRLAGLIGISRDITERRLMQERLMRANTANALRADVSLAIAGGTSTEAMLEACLKAVVLHLKGRSARIWTLNVAEQVLEVKASSGDLAIHEMVRRVPVGSIMIGTVAESRKPYMTNNAQADPRLAGLRDYMVEHGLVAWAGHPLLVDGRLIGVMAMFSDEKLSEFTLEVLAASTELIAQGMERKRLEDELKRQNEQLLALDHMKSVFVSSVSHELRTPLTSILGFAEFLEDELDGPLTPGQQDYVAQIQGGTRRLQRLVDDLLNFARLESGAFKLNLQQVDLGEVVKGVAEGLKPQIEAKRLTLTLDRPASLAPLQLDAARIEQVLVILLDNAIKFTPEHGALRIRLAATPSAVRVIVEDTGTGIASADLPRVFERFFQADASLTRTGGGTGLGLSIAQALIEAHGGRIGAESEPGKGSAFWFELPR